MGDNWFLNLMRGVWSFIIGSLRIILFLGILLFILIQSLWIASLLYLEKPLTVILPQVGFNDFRGLQQIIHAVSVLMVALIGCYGAFYKHQLSLKAFTFLNALNTIMLIWVLLSKAPEADTFNDKLQDKLQYYQTKYDFRARFGSRRPSEVKTATEVWDQLQMFGCCGISEPQDWDQYRPHNYSSSTYPISCCTDSVVSRPVYPVQPDGFCSKESAYFHSTGCMRLIKAAEVCGIMMYVIFIVAQLFLCAISCTIVFFDMDEVRLPTSADYTPANTINYQRFTSSLYDDKQLSENESDCQEPKPLYPDAQSASPLPSNS